MTKFVVGQTQATKESVVLVDAGLPVGAHRFQLSVQDADGNRSAPARALVQVVLPTVPSPIVPPIGIVAPIGTIAPPSTGVPPLIASTGAPAVTGTPVVRAPTSTPVAAPKGAAPAKRKPRKKGSK